DCVGSRPAADDLPDANVALVAHHGTITLAQAETGELKIPCSRYAHALEEFGILEPGGGGGPQEIEQHVVLLGFGERGKAGDALQIVRLRPDSEKGHVAPAEPPEEGG